MAARVRKWKCLRFDPTVSLIYKMIILHYKRMYFFLLWSDFPVSEVHLITIEPSVEPSGKGGSLTL